MQKLATMALMTSLFLTGCASVDGQSQPSQNIAMQMFAQAVDNKCRSEINEQPLYQAASLLMTQQQKQNFENKVCGCVSKKAPEHVTYKELGRAVIDSEARPEIVASVVGKTLKRAWVFFELMISTCCNNLTNRFLPLTVAKYIQCQISF